MKVLIVLGSRNPQGQTARAADALLQGVTDEGSQGERVFLPKMKIESCRQCEDSGWGICRTEGKCVIEDDFAAIVGQIRDADAVVFANPVYFSDLSESMRAFTDRLRRTCMHEAGRDKIADKPAIGICVAGGGGGGAPACAVSLEKVLQRCGFDVVDMIPARRQNLDMKVNILEITGKWLTTCPSSG
ncbi:TPA: flavodoxin family protein [Candidatus Poribacteria bacterium]|nr:flavodoxin family protein [Candidatus Poribacteria bacterium]